MIDEAGTRDGDLAGKVALAAARDDIAKALHDWDHGQQENDSPEDPCWHSWRVEADLLLPIIRSYVAHAWEDGYRDAAAYFRRGRPSSGPLVRHNPYGPIDASAEHPCGHWLAVRGCGGCDPAAIDYEFGGGL